MQDQAQAPPCPLFLNSSRDAAGTPAAPRPRRRRAKTKRFRQKARVAGAERERDCASAVNNIHSAENKPGRKLLCDSRQAARLRRGSFMLAGDGRGAGTHPSTSLSPCWSTVRAGDRVPTQNFVLGTLKHAAPRREPAGRLMVLATVAGNRHPPKCPWQGNACG